MTLNGDSVAIVKNVTGSVSGSNLTIGVNGINSSPINVQMGGGKQLYTGSLDSLFSIDTEDRRVTVLEEFDIEYVGSRTNLGTTRVTISKGTYSISSSSNAYLYLGQTILLDDGRTASNMRPCYISIGIVNGELAVSSDTKINSNEVQISNSSGYRLFK